MAKPNTSVAKATPTPAPEDAIQEVPAADTDLGVSNEDDGEESMAPEGFPLPAKGLKWPEPGVVVYYVTFKAEWTMRPKKGNRTCVVWGLSAAEERAAGKKSQSDARIFIAEATKAMIRCIDGNVANHMNPALEGSVGAFWDEIGGKCRSQLENIYMKLHHMQLEELADFFEGCVAARTVAV